MFCTRCGASNPDDARFCQKCGAPIAASALPASPGPSAPPPPPLAPAWSAPPPPAPAWSAPPPPPAAAAAAWGPQYTGVAYAGFWRRFFAYVIDGLVLSLVMTPVYLVVLGIASSGQSSFSRGEMSTGTSCALTALYLVLMVIVWLYSACFESSGKQATLGKMAMGVKVTDLHGNRISFGRATGRCLGKVLSGALMGIGFIMAGFTEKKQGLHDMLAGTVVLRN